MTSRYDRIRETLEGAFQPSEISIIDESHKHAGHSGAAAGGQTHYRVVLVSEAFQGLSRLARYRAVHDALDAEFKTGLHALSLGLFTSNESNSVKTI